MIAAAAAGPLTGHTVAVKDLFAIAGFPRGAGVPDYLGAPESRHAAVVAALLAAGADITGIAHTDEFAYSITGSNGRYGMPLNPAALLRVPGGSSSGSAVAVSSAQATIGLGTDTAGSIRVPAAYQGLWGIRTTHGSISTDGLLPLAQSFDTVGWMTRDVETLSAVADYLLPRGTAPYLGAESAELSPHAGELSACGVESPPGSASLGLDPESRADSASLRTDSASERIDSPSPQLVVDPDLCAIADSALAACALAAAERLGAEHVRLEADLGSWFAAFRVVQAWEAWANHGAWIAGHPNSLEPEVAQRFAYAAAVSGDAADKARLVLAEASDHLRAALMGRVLLLPTTATLPPLRDALPADLEAGRTRTLHLTCLASLAGLPAVTVPMHEVEGIPAGLCLVGAPHTDVALIGLARDVTEAQS